MSLQLLAKQMEAKGRDGDSVLVHMTPGEVEGLQKLAKAAGGSLSVNPDTGLVEASFLKSILPAVAGVVGTKFFGPLGGQIAGTLAGTLVGGKDGAQGSTEQGVAGRVRAGENVQLRSPYEMPGNKEDYPYAYESGRPVVAAQGGLMQFAEGGMTGASADAFEYLMGNAEMSPAMRNAIESKRASDEALAARATQMAAPQDAGVQTSGNGLIRNVRGLASGIRGLASGMARDLARAEMGGQNTAAGSNKMFSFDPVTGTFVRNTNYVDPMARQNAPTGLMSMIASGDTGMSGTPGDPVTDAQMAEFYAERPTMGRFTRAVQAPFERFMDPNDFQRQQNLTLGVSAAPSRGLGYTGDNNAETGEGGGYADNRGMGSEVHGDMPSGTFASGGLMGLSKGGMASGGFVVPADVVSALGNGSTDAGLRSLKSMLGGVKPIKGKGDGLSDSIKTNIDGKQPARVADGEAYIDPKTVKRIGGAKKLYAMMDKIRVQAHGKTTQQRKVNPAKV